MDENETPDPPHSDCPFVTNQRWYEEQFKTAKEERREMSGEIKAVGGRVSVLISKVESSSTLTARDQLSEKTKARQTKIILAVIGGVVTLVVAGFGIYAQVAS